MTGVLRETDYHTIKEQYESDQRQLSQYTNSQPTTIAVVRLPRDTGIEEMCDEWWPALGLPERHLKRYWEYKSGFKTNSAVDDAEERAYEEARVEHYYRRYVQKSAEAQRAIRMLVERLRDGEDITLVCFEETAQNCHRSELRQMIESRLSSAYDFREKQVV